MLNCCIIIAAGSMTSSFGCISETINSGAFEKYRCSAPVFIRGSGKLSAFISDILPRVKTFHHLSARVYRNLPWWRRWACHGRKEPQGWISVDMSTGPNTTFFMCHLKQVTSLLVSAHPSGSCCSFLMYEGFVGASHFPDRKNWRGRCSDTPPQCFTEWFISPELI